MSVREHDFQNEHGGDGRFGPSPRLYERAHAVIEERIRSGTLVAGAALTETTVAAEFGISRAPSRRALAELERIGLIERAEGRGYIVRPVGPGPARSVPAPRNVSLRLVPEQSWQRIYRIVEEEIAARISFAAWRLNEVELARHFRVSRTVTRDVIGRLEQRGLLRKDQKSRWVAPALTPDRISQLYELRWLLEPAALAKAMPNLPPGLASEKRHRLETALALPSSVAAATLDDLERDLHVVTLSFCQSETLMHAIEQPQSLLIAHKFLYRWTAQLFDVEPFLGEHLAIFDNVLAGRADDAASALERHLRDSRDRAIARVGVIGSGPQPEVSSFLERID